MAISRDVIRRATTDPSRPAVVGEQTRTFSELLSGARVRADALDPDDPFVVCRNDDPVTTLTDVIAADLLGAAAVLIDQSWPAWVREQALHSAREAVVRTAIGGSRLVVFTSGTTGIPRPIVRTTTSWTYSFPTFSAYAGIDPDDTVLIPGRLSFSLFLFGALHALTVGAAIHPLRRFSPSSVAGALAEGPDGPGCRVAHAVPTMLGPLLDAPGELRLAIVGGAHLDPRLRERAEQSAVQLIDYYGSSELSFVAIRRDNGRLRPFPGVRVEGREGVLWVRTPYRASNLHTSPDGFATSGDLGRVEPDGAVVVSGRPDAVITTGGATVQAEGIEQVLRGAPTVGEAVVLGTPHPELGQVVTAVVEPIDADHELALSQLRSLTSERLTSSERPRLWYMVEKLPRTGSGKVARSEVAAALAENALDGKVLT